MHIKKCCLCQLNNRSVKIVLHNILCSFQRRSVRPVPSDMNLADIQLERLTRVVKMMDHWLKSAVLSDNIYFKIPLLCGRTLILNFLYISRSILLTPFFSWKRRNIFTATLMIGVYKFYENWSTETFGRKTSFRVAR